MCRVFSHLGVMSHQFRFHTRILLFNSANQFGFCFLVGGPGRHFVVFRSRPGINSRVHTGFRAGWGHPGLDWASGYPFAGWQEGLNFSIAYTFNSFRGMNTTLDSLGNGQTHMYQTLSCRVYEAATRRMLASLASCAVGIIPKSSNV